MPEPDVRFPRNSGLGLVPLSDPSDQSDVSERSRRAEIRRIN